MALKLRPTGLGARIDKDRPDYTVYSGEWGVGRTYETHKPAASLHSPATSPASESGAKFGFVCSACPPGWESKPADQLHGAGRLAAVSKPESRSQRPDRLNICRVRASRLLGLAVPATINLHVILLPVRPRPPTMASGSLLFARVGCRIP